MKKLDDLTKAKLIYSGELLIFSVLFLVLGILTMTGVIGVSERRIMILTIITLIGGAYFLFNTIWFFVSPKKRAKNSWVDTLLLFPVPLIMVPVDLIRLITGAIPNEAYPYIIGGLFLYVTVAYTIEAIYHWFVPLPILVEAAKEDAEEKEKASSEAQEIPEDKE